ncbi:hypothetical protein HQ531_10530 [bacterium]|nr:hypothetical protein [bacterium]
MTRYVHGRRTGVSVCSYCCSSLQKVILSLCFLHSLLISLFAGEYPVKFNHLTSEDGLSQNAVYAILQDGEGFMWFGTRFGLNRYDGKEFKAFRHDPLDASSLPDFWVKVLCEDSQGNIWIGTPNGGVSKYIKHLEKFISFKHDPEDSSSISSNFITSIFEDSQESIWIGTENGLNKYDKLTNSFTTYRYNSGTLNSINQNRISAIAEIPRGTLWLGTENGSLLTLSLDSLNINLVSSEWVGTSIMTSSLLVDKTKNVMWIGQFGLGLFKYDQSEGTIIPFGLVDGRSISKLLGILSISQSNNGLLWIGSSEGVVKYDPRTDNYEIFQHDENDPSSLSDNMIYSTYFDDQGIFWLGTESGGINQYDPDLIRFQHYHREADNPNSLYSNMVFSISKDQSGNIWFGTLGGGTSVMNPSTGIFTHYTSDDTKVNWSKNYISRVLPAKDQSIWIGTFSCGLYKLDYPIGKIEHYRNHDLNTNSFGDKTTRALLETRDGTIWIGTETQGLDRFDKLSDSFTHFRHEPDNPNSISSNSIYSLLEDEAGYIWIGTADQGLNRFDRKSETFTHFKVSQSGEQSITDNNVLALYEDPDNNLWIGTRSGGLNKLDPDRKTISTLDLHSELSSLAVFGILQDDKKYLWLSTNQGLLKAHPDSGLINAYTVSDGLQSEFYFSSCVRSEDGLMYFGGMDGYNVFHPDSIKNNPHVPPIFLTGLAINYEDVPIGEDHHGPKILNHSISYSNELQLRHSDKVITFKFAALNYSASYKNQYKYIMEGYDEAWIDAGTENTAQYMNLPAGTYTFRVRGSNNDGIWNMEGTSIGVSISPPYWKTWWFNTLLALGLLGIILFYIHLRTVKLIAQRQELEALVRERTKELKSEIEERQRVETEKTQLHMDHLKRELVTKSIHLTEKQEILTNLLNEIKKFETLEEAEVKGKLNKVTRYFTSMITKGQDWEEFEKWFTEVHTDFYNILREEHQDLSQREIKVCALLRLNLLTKEIAGLLNVQPATIEIYRHRIRKKMKMDPEENLNLYLSQL